MFGISRSTLFRTLKVLKQRQPVSAWACPPRWGGVGDSTKSSEPWLHLLHAQASPSGNVTDPARFDLPA